MSNVLQLVENEQTSEFYPTPPALVSKMLEGIDWRTIHTILEPSAGKGDILRIIAADSDVQYYEHLDVDCIEIDPNLRQILKFNFSDNRKLDLRNRANEIDGTRTFDRETRRYTELTAEQKYEKKMIEAELKTFFKNGIHIVHDDFLTYNPFKSYDLIIMNPPFSNGDKHLLKALKIQERGGKVVCLLNAETLRNPYTENRKELKRLLYEYGAEIEYIENAFSSAERIADVEIALVRVNIEPVVEESDIYKHFERAEEVEDFNPEITDIEVTDYIKAAVHRFNIEVKAGLELIRQYKAMIPYMACKFDGDKYSQSPILRLTDSNERGYDSTSGNSYIKKVRYKYWSALLANPKFTGRLTSKLQDEYRRRVEKLSDYDFSEFNIYTLSAEMNTQIKRGIEDEIIAMFDRLTEEHSWYPETQKNRHYFTGWATNTAHKIGKKVIIPCYGIFNEWGGSLREYEARKVLEDIERILNFLDGGMTAEVNSWEILTQAFNQGITKNIELKYFSATFYKKGTVHLVFNCPQLIERFNIYAAQNKAWLPPCYGKKTYANMTAKEKTVIDEFQGESAYAEVIKKSSYYFAPVTSGTPLMLESGA